jgi:hypothetical protein
MSTEAEVLAALIERAGGAVEFARGACLSLAPEQQDELTDRLIGQPWGVSRATKPHVTLRTLLRRARSIFPERLDAAGVLVRLTVDVGKLARYVRGATKDTVRCSCTDGPVVGVADADCPRCYGTGRHSSLDLALIMGNLLFSTIRWCDDLGLDPVECVRRAAEAQERFARENPER